MAGWGGRLGVGVGLWVGRGGRGCWGANVGCWAVGDNGVVPSI